MYYTIIRNTRVVILFVGPDLSINIAYHQMVSSPDRQSGYTIGGHNDDRNKEIFKFSCSNTGTCQWTRVETKLGYGRQNFVAIKIPDDLANKFCT